ncbi:hypothetical protein UCRNP2_7477 [Neofusicoccum parvum UCRNP2]|uniref:Uncharacterized protein n=1 Tax=Botryosphaeria parva (strain UCR-NP2) TaxID=1287680 RepID=R1G2Y9_BOTPV|nr:hypothetical protein UCRNP2_7477 [Neofusicoccum parvum UCRNP2]
MNFKIATALLAILPAWLAYASPIGTVRSVDSEEGQEEVQAWGGDLNAIDFKTKRNEVEDAETADVQAWGGDLNAIDFKTKRGEAEEAETEDVQAWGGDLNAIDFKRDV